MGGLGGGRLWKRGNPKPGKPSRYGNNLRTPLANRTLAVGVGMAGPVLGRWVGVTAVVAKERAVPALPACLGAGPWKF